jgi:23S rRNA (guanine2445-N2)-methyltransferase / 23S rRNA (guanine2069-N7)-methyltransferase
VQLKVPTSNVYLKQRKRDKGGSQYAERDVRGSNSTQHLIAEDGLVFEVDFAAHLDTGIFLDHRSTRHWLREQARGKDCLNLFAYTGTASVFMAAGGAKSVTTLDLSNTYQAWAQRNMERNGFKDTRRYHFEQADALRWVQEQRHAPDAQRYDLIFVDPPTFSNSARMGTRSWDVQRDHVELLIAVSRLLAPGGQAVFSTNLRSFKLDEENLAKAHVVAKDITPSTIPPDFERNARIHHCYLLSRSA